jgi:hypothetical protein
MAASHMSEPWAQSEATLRRHLVQGSQQPQPAGKADLMLAAGAVSLSGAGDQPQTAGRRLGDVQHNANLHVYIV